MLKSSVTVSKQNLKGQSKCNFLLLLRFEDKLNSCMYDELKCHDEVKSECYDQPITLHYV